MNHSTNIAMIKSANTTTPNVPNKDNAVIAINKTLIVMQINIANVIIILLLSIIGNKKLRAV